MDTVQIRIRGIDKINIASWAPLYPEFSTRTYSELSSVERMRLQNKKIPYLRKFVLHPDSEFYIPKVEIFETANERMRSVEYDARIACSLPTLIFANSLQEIAISNQQEIFNTFIERLHSVGLRIPSYVIPMAQISLFTGHGTPQAKASAMSEKSTIHTETAKLDGLNWWRWNQIPMEIMK